MWEKNDNLNLESDKNIEDNLKESDPFAKIHMNLQILFLERCAFSLFT